VAGVLVGPLAHLVHHQADHVHTETGEIELGFGWHQEHEEHESEHEHEHEHGHEHALKHAHEHEHEHEHALEHATEGDDEHATEREREHQHEHEHPQPVRHGAGSLQHFGVALLSPVLFVMPPSLFSLVELRAAPAPATPDLQTLYSPAQPRGPPA
jgi:hypothetical protein